MNSRSEIKRLGTLDPEKVTEAYFKLKAERDRYRNVLEAVRSQMCWEADRDQLTMGMRELHPAVTQALAPDANDPTNDGTATEVGE